MNNIDLVHLGDFCEPGIIIDEILNINKKHLFMLGGYNFNNILHFLNDNNYENIYNRQLLRPGTKITTHHILYKFFFNHDYVCDDTLKITNYDFVKNRFDIKIKNFRDMLASPNLAIFINFTTNIDLLNINGMIKWLNAKKSNYHMIIFTNNNYSFVNNEKKLSIIKLQHSYHEWFKRSRIQNKNVYKEMYEKFIDCCKKNNYSHNFPKTFETTHLGKTL